MNLCRDRRVKHLSFPPHFPLLPPRFELGQRLFQNSLKTQSEAPHPTSQSLVSKKLISITGNSPHSAPKQDAKHTHHGSTRCKHKELPTSSTLAVGWFHLDWAIHLSNKTERSSVRVTSRQAPFQAPLTQLKVLQFDENGDCYRCSLQGPLAHYPNLELSGKSCQDLPEWPQLAQQFYFLSPD